MAWFLQLGKFCFLSCLIFFTSLHHVSCNTVSLELYFESLCPYSAAFIVKHLNKIFKNGIIDIVDLNLVPWGNAKLLTNNTFECQHGENECLLNTVEACAIDVWPKVNEHFPFIFCVENLVSQGKYEQWNNCFKKLGLDSKPVLDCYNSGRGLKLERKYAAETEALQPPHEYVPWVVVDGQPLYEDFENFSSYICKAYKGTPVPDACNRSVSVPRRQTWKSIPSVCYREATSSKVSGLRAVLLSWINELLH